MSFKDLAFREKSAIIHLITLTILLAFTLTIIWPFFSGYEESILVVKPLWVAVIIFILLEIIGHSIVAARNSKEANANSDEREKLIVLKASFYSSHVLGFILIGYLALSMLLQIPFLSIYFVFIAFVIAEIINYASQLVLYRRGV
jgi:small-conductance mechanosensitive channel